MSESKSDKFWSYIEKIMDVVLAKVLHIEFTESTWTGLVQFVKFGIVGVSNTFLGLIIYAVNLRLMRVVGICQGYDYYIAQLIAFLLSVLWSFYWNNKAVFKQEEGEYRSVFRALLKTYISYAFTSLFLSEVLLMLWVDVIGLNEYVGPLLSLLITVPLNFVIQKFWAFRKK